MSWGDKKELAIENASLKREVELLRASLQEKREEVVELRKQLWLTQEALVAKESPEAYRDRKYAEEIVNSKTESQEEIEERKQQAEILHRYIDELEKPLFKDASDMIDSLSRLTGNTSTEAFSVHGNSES